MNEWMYCGRVSFGIAEILDCQTEFSVGIVETNRDSFEAHIASELWLYYCGEMPEEELDTFLKLEAKKKAAEYESYWHKVIAIYADNKVKEL